MDTKIIGIDPNDTLTVGDYTIRFEFDTAQYDSVILTSFDKLENVWRFMPGVAEIIGQVKNTYIRQQINLMIQAANERINSEGMGLVTGYDVIFGEYQGYSVPTAITCKIRITKNPWPVLYIVGLIVASFAVAVVVLPEPARAYLKKGWQTLVDMVAYAPERLIAGTAANMLNRLWPYILAGGIGYMIYKGKLKW